MRFGAAVSVANHVDASFVGTTATFFGDLVDVITSCTESAVDDTVVGFDVFKIASAVDAVITVVAFGGLSHSFVIEAFVSFVISSFSVHLSTEGDIMTAHARSVLDSRAIANTVFFLVIAELAGGVFGGLIVGLDAQIDFTSFGFGVHVFIRTADRELGVNRLVVLIVADNAAVATESVSVLGNKTRVSFVILVLAEFQIRFAFFGSGTPRSDGKRVEWLAHAFSELLAASEVFVWVGETADAGVGFVAELAESATDTAEDGARHFHEAEGEDERENLDGETENNTEHAVCAGDENPRSKF